MEKIKSRKTFILVVAISGILVNAIYAIGLLAAFFKPLATTAEREILTSAIGLETGWTALLIWMIIKPLERRIILLFTIIPVMLGNIFHSINQNMTASAKPGVLIFNTLFGLIYAGLFVVAYIWAKPAERLTA